MANTHRWLKFWPGDWQKDPALRCCCVAARGLWIDIICLMHEANPYGHLVIGGRPATMKQLSAITGTTEREAAKLVAELENAGVFSRADDGTIYSRRMVRDNEAAMAGRDAVAKRWEKTKQPIRGGEENMPDPPISPPNSLEYRVQKKEAEERKEEERGSGVPVTPTPREAAPIVRPPLPSSPPNMAWIDGITPGASGTGEVGGYDVDVVLTKLLEAAGMDLSRKAESHKTVVGWLRDGFDTGDMLMWVRRKVLTRKAPGTLAGWDLWLRQDLQQVRKRA